MEASRDELMGEALARLAGGPGVEAFRGLFGDLLSAHERRAMAAMAAGSTETYELSLPRIGKLPASVEKAWAKIVERYPRSGYIMASYQPYPHSCHPSDIVCIVLLANGMVIACKPSARDSTGAHSGWQYWLNDCDIDSVFAAADSAKRPLPEMTDSVIRVMLPFLTKLGTAEQPERPYVTSSTAGLPSGITTAGWFQSCTLNDHGHYGDGDGDGKLRVVLTLWEQLVELSRKWRPWALREQLLVRREDELRVCIAELVQREAHLTRFTAETAAKMAVADERIAVVDELEAALARASAEKADLLQRLEAAERRARTAAAVRNPSLRCEDIAAGAPSPYRE